MGLSDKLRVEGTLDQLELDVGHKWVIALKPITTSNKRSLDHQKQSSTSEEDAEEASNGSAGTPTSEESRIPSLLLCPPAPTKRSSNSPSSSMKYNQHNRVMEFFIPPNLESVFVRRM